MSSKKGEELGRVQDHDHSEKSHAKVYRETHTYTQQKESQVHVVCHGKSSSNFPTY